MQDVITSGLVTPVDIAVDPVSERVYWTENSPADFMIFRANLDGTGVEPLVARLTSPSGIAVDGHDSKIYWTEGGRSVWSVHRTRTTVGYHGRARAFGSRARPRHLD